MPVIDLTEYITEHVAFDVFPLHYHPIHRFFRCRVCNTAVRNVESHFPAQHPKEFSKSLRQLPVIKTQLPEFNPEELMSTCSVAYPHPTFIHGIRFEANGFSCVHCAYFLPTRKSMEQHVRTSKHNLDDGGKGKSCTDDYKRDVFIQAFFQGSHAKWFPSTPPSNFATVASVSELLALFESQMNQASKPSTTRTLCESASQPHSLPQVSPPRPLLSLDSPSDRFERASPLASPSRACSPRASPPQPFLPQSVPRTFPPCPPIQQSSPVQYAHPLLPSSPVFTLRPPSLAPSSAVFEAHAKKRKRHDESSLHTSPKKELRAARKSVYTEPDPRLSGSQPSKSSLHRSISRPQVGVRAVPSQVGLEWEETSSRKPRTVHIDVVRASQETPEADEFGAGSRPLSVPPDKTLPCSQVTQRMPPCMKRNLRRVVLVQSRPGTPLPRRVTPPLFSDDYVYVREKEELHLETARQQRMLQTFISDLNVLKGDFTGLISPGTWVRFSLWFRVVSSEERYMSWKVRRRLQGTTLEQPICEVCPIPNGPDLMCELRAEWGVEEEAEVRQRLPAPRICSAGRYLHLDRPIPLGYDTGPARGCIDIQSPLEWVFDCQLKPLPRRLSSEVGHGAGWVELPVFPPPDSAVVSAFTSSAARLPSTPLPPHSSVATQEASLESSSLTPLKSIAAAREVSSVSSSLTPLKSPAAARKVSLVSSSLTTLKSPAASLLARTLPESFTSSTARVDSDQRAWDRESLTANTERRASFMSPVDDYEETKSVTADSLLSEDDRHERSQIIRLNNVVVKQELPEGQTWRIRDPKAYVPHSSWTVPGTTMDLMLKLREMYDGDWTSSYVMQELETHIWAQHHLTDRQRLMSVVWNQWRFTKGPMDKINMHGYMHDFVCKYAPFFKIARLRKEFERFVTLFLFERRLIDLSLAVGTVALYDHLVEGQNLPLLTT